LWDGGVKHARAIQPAALAALAVLAAALLVAATVTLATAPANHTDTRRTIGYGQTRFDGAGPERWAARYRAEHRHTLELRRRLRQRLVAAARNPLPAITLIFGPYAGQAIQVADCETGGTFSTGARNGQHLGLFQMGAAERRLYGHGPSALDQARAAYVYFVVSGRDWRPWTCKP
jgi:hypothetical protein